MDLNSNANNSNGTDASKSYEPRISTFSRVNADYNHRQVGRLPSGPRKKSALVESMAANFEQKTPDSSTTSNSMITSVRSSSYNSRIELGNAVGVGGSGAKLENGVNSSTTTTRTNGIGKADSAAPMSPRTTTKQAENSKSSRHDLDDDDAASTPPPRQKSGPSARRGKLQKEKRMLRQKRRSTGVVRLKESDDEDDTKNDKSQNKNGEDKNAEDNPLYISETEKNTLSNELSPSVSRDPVSSSSSSARYQSYEKKEHSSTSILKTTSSSPRSAYSSNSQRTSDSVFTTDDASPSPRSTTMPTLNSSRRRGKLSSNDKSPQEPNVGSSAQDKQEIEELRQKLASAESTVTKLTKEIEAMDADLRALEEENSRLKKENKMLEDENLTMLRLMKR